MTVTSVVARTRRVIGSDVRRFAMARIALAILAMAQGIFAAPSRATGFHAWSWAGEDSAGSYQGMTGHRIAFNYGAIGCVYEPYWLVLSDSPSQWLEVGLSHGNCGLGSSHNYVYAYYDLGGGDAGFFDSELAPQDNSSNLYFTLKIIHNSRVGM